MPDKRYKRGCGPSCVGCWINRLKHGNAASKAYLKKHPELNWNVKHSNENLSETESETESVPIDSDEEAYILEQQKAVLEQQKAVLKKKKLQRKETKEYMKSFPQEIREELF
jgi:hypothetical protein